MKKSVSVAVGAFLLILTSSATLAQFNEQVSKLGAEAIKFGKPLDPQLAAQLKQFCRAMGAIVYVATVGNAQMDFCRCPEGLVYADGVGCTKIHQGPGTGSKIQDPKSVRTQ